MFKELWKKLMDRLYKRVYVKVGDRLGCSKWGPNSTEIEVVQVSEDGLEFRYVFIRAKGNRITSRTRYSRGIDFLGELYRHIPNEK